MSVEQRIPIPIERELPDCCRITVESGYISIHFDPPLAEGPHKMTRLETIAAGALMGIARTLTGHGEAAVIAALVQFDKKTGAKR